MTLESNISVVIPTYNNLLLFKRAVTSVLKQSVLPKEIIVTDDSTTNEIQHFCESIGQQIVRYSHNQPSLGAVNNWNNGISQATGDWIILLHHDEELGNHDYLETISKLTKEHDLIISDIRVRTANGERKGRINGIMKYFFLHIASLNLCFNSIGPCACVMFKKEKTEYFDQKLTWLVDMEWYYRLLLKSKKVFFSKDHIIYSNHGHADQITANIEIKDIETKDIKWLYMKYDSSLSIKMALTAKKIIRLIRSL